MGKCIKNREPLTEAEVLEYLNRNVEANAKRWGEKDFYTKRAIEVRDRKMEQFRNGEVVGVWTEEYVDSYGNGCGSYEDELFSDGTVKTYCYGYLD